MPKVAPGAPSAPPTRAAAILALAGQTAIAASTFVIAKQALAAFRPLELAGLRLIGAALVMGSLAAFARGGGPSLRRRAGELAFLGFIGVTVNQICFLTGLATSTPTHAALLYALTPAFVHVLALAAGDERPSLPLALGIGIAMAGAAVVIAARSHGVAMRATLGGDLLILVGVVAWAVYSARARAAVREIGALRFTAATLVVGAVCGLPITVPGMRHLAPATIPPSAWAGLAFLVLFTSGLAYALWTWALRGLTASQVAVFASTQPVATALLSYVVLGESVGAPLVAGGALVLAGVALTQRRGPETAPPATAGRD
jgi:drug/metabolite transporter (DMT)-like permease